ncbi:dienelactone hydrolase family protein [Aquibium sp. A9E412]|uniref:dienelactone hydrolase family protein n=1 Tax=Aquibium sp. A9E412 TaxID=2976767 RepID=UPI0025AFA264|nr:dienelactone hydrolase family protein [Aquibium sp. A9E412]MDN2568150.1 dienelactone hydrolase family protein [Aquibium sp. A9E412]
MTDALLTTDTGPTDTGTTDTGAPPPRPVRFASASPTILPDIARGPRHAPPVELCGELHLPADTSGPVPACVVLQGLGGPMPAREGAYGRLLADAGCAGLVIDGFAARGIRSRTDTMRALRLTEAMMLADAFAALAYLAERPEIDAGRIHVVGFSYGGMIAMLCAYRQIADLYARSAHRFAGHISYYGCSIARLDAPATTGSPVLLLVGGRDGNVSVPRSHAIADDMQRGGSPVRLVVYEDACHQWDGEDETPRHVNFNLRNCRMRVAPDNTITDERTGLRMRGATSRALLIATAADPRGYTILRDRATTRRSNAALVSMVKG